MAISLALVWAAGSSRADEQGLGEIVGVASIIDGDTNEIHGVRIRLHAIDTPESSQTCRQRDGTVWRCGRAAALALSDLLGRRTVGCWERDQDRYGRIVAVCAVQGEDLGAWLVRRGLALAYRRYSLDYVKDEDSARAAGAGMWAGDFIQPWKWRRGRRLSSPSSSPQIKKVPEPLTGPNLDCGDFGSWQEAQAFFERAGSGDPHRLDRDRDGIACEALRR